MKGYKRTSELAHRRALIRGSLLASLLYGVYIISDIELRVTSIDFEPSLLLLELTLLPCLNRGLACPCKFHRVAGSQFNFVLEAWEALTTRVEEGGRRGQSVEG